jgi:hypothetical protein
MNDVIRYAPVPSDPQKPVFNTLNKGEQGRILKIQLSIEKYLIEVKFRFFEIGKLLSRAKEILPHGTFQRWIEETWRGELPYPTAACYRAIYERFKNEKEKITVIPITLLQQMAQDSFPDEIIKMITDNPEAFKGNASEIRAAYAEFKKGEIDLSEFESLATKVIAIGIDMYNGVMLENHSRTGKRVINLGLTELKAAIWKIRKYSYKIRSFFPPAKGEPMSFSDKEVAEHNAKVDAVTQGLLDDDLIKEINYAIEELELLRDEIEERKGRRGGFFLERLVKQDGITRAVCMNNPN